MSDLRSEQLDHASEYFDRLDVFLGTVAAVSVIGSLFAPEPMAKRMFRVGFVAAASPVRKLLGYDAYVEQSEAFQRLGELYSDR